MSGAADSRALLSDSAVLGSANTSFMAQTVACRRGKTTDPGEGSTAPSQKNEPLREVTRLAQRGSIRLLDQCD